MGDNWNENTCGRWAVMAMDKLSMRMERLREMVQGQLEGLSKWQLALLFGTPVTLGLVGFIYYKSKKHKKKSDCKGNSAAGARSKEKEVEVCFSFNCSFHYFSILHVINSTAPHINIL